MTPGESSPQTIRYGTVAISLHWLIAVLIVVAFYLGWIMTDIPGFTPVKLRYFSWHKWIGVTVFAFSLYRLSWRVVNPPPSLPETVSAWQRRGANVVHGLLYVLMLAIPLTGYFYSSASGIQVVYLGIVPLPVIVGPNEALKVFSRICHVSLNYVLLTLVVLHVSAAIKHHLVDHDGLLMRMLPFVK
ncbi:UNVERIFIED_ORG: cytochrome b561 [Burkholderia sp. CF145]